MARRRFREVHEVHIPERNLTEEIEGERQYQRDKAEAALEIKNLRIDWALDNQDYFAEEHGKVDFGQEPIVNREQELDRAAEELDSLSSSWGWDDISLDKELSPREKELSELANLSTIGKDSFAEISDFDEKKTSSEEKGAMNADIIGKEQKQTPQDITTQNEISSNDVESLRLQALSLQNLGSIYGLNADKEVHDEYAKALRNAYMEAKTLKDDFSLDVIMATSKKYDIDLATPNDKIARSQDYSKEFSTKMTEALIKTSDVHEKLELGLPKELLILAQEGIEMNKQGLPIPKDMVDMIDEYSFNDKQIEEINFGLLHGLSKDDVSRYADPSISAEKMFKFRSHMESLVPWSPNSSTKNSKDINKTKSVEKKVNPLFYTESFVPWKSNTSTKSTKEANKTKNLDMDVEK